MNNSSPFALPVGIFLAVSLTTIKYQYQITMGTQRQFIWAAILQVGTIAVHGNKFTDILPEYQCTYSMWAQGNLKAEIRELSSLFIGQKLIFHRYCIQNVKHGIQIQVYNINNESVNHFSQFISVKVKENWRKSQAQFREKFRKLRPMKTWC